MLSHMTTEEVLLDGVFAGWGTCFSVPGLHMFSAVFHFQGLTCDLYCVFLVSGTMYVVSWSLGMKARSTWSLCL